MVAWIVVTDTVYQSFVKLDIKNIPYIYFKSRKSQ